MRPLRFALLSTFYPPYSFGGDARVLECLARALAERGHEVDVFHNADAYRMLSTKGEPEPQPQHPAIHIHRLEHPLGRLACFALHQAGRPVVHGNYIWRVMADRRFDIIHFHNVSLMGGPGILSYGEGLKLYTTHEYWLVCPTHVLWQNNAEPCIQPSCARCLLHYRRPPQPWRASNLLEASLVSIDAFCAPSRFAADKHAEFGFTRRFDILPNFLPDTPLPESISLPPGLPPRYFLFAGRLENLKGLDDAIPLFGPDASASLVIAGSGTAEGKLRALAAGSPNVRFLGHVDNHVLRHLYRNALALVLPSRCFEVFPLVIVEAFRERTPVIARRVGALPELLEHGGGILFDDVDGLRRAIEGVTADDDVRAALGNEGRRAYESFWTENVVLRAYFGLIHNLALKRGFDEVADSLKAV